MITSRLPVFYAVILASILALPPLFGEEFDLWSPMAGCPVEAFQEWDASVQIFQLGDHRWTVQSRMVDQPFPDGSGAREVLRVIGDVRREVAYTPEVWSEDATAVLREGRGNCISFVAVTEDRLRKAGFSTRRVHGLLFSRRGPDSPFYLERLKATPHRWLRVFLPDVGWVSFDPVSPSGRITARHLPFQGDDLAADLEGLRIEVVRWD